MQAPPPPPSTGSIRSGWFPDPSGRHEFRFHNGETWTADVADDGRRFVDPIGEPPAIWGTVPPATGGPNRAATASVVSGVLGIVMGLLPFVFVFGGLAALLAVVLGTAGMRRARRGARHAGRARIGVITGGLGLLATVVGTLFTIALVDAVDRFENPGDFELSPLTCESDGTAWTAAGSITNLDDDERSYLLTVEFRRSGTDNVQVSSRVAVDDVAPEFAADFSVRRVISIDDVECVVAEVDGPAPFGLDIGG